MSFLRLCFLCSGSLVLEALDGFIFVVNREGRIDFASENLTDYLGFQPEAFTERPIFNFIHRGDHARQLHNSLIAKHLLDSQTLARSFRPIKISPAISVLNLDTNWIRIQWIRIRIWNTDQDPHR